MKVLILECGKGFGGALTSLKAFLDEVPHGSGYRFHLLTSYPQELIQKGGCVRAVRMVPRHRLYGPDAGLERLLARVLPKWAGHLASMADLVLGGWIYCARIYFYLKRHHIDILHLNNSILINDFGILAGYLAGTKVVAQIRAPEYPSKVARALGALVDQFMPISGFVSQSLKALGVPDRKITLIPEGLDSHWFIKASNLALPPGMPAQKKGAAIGMVGCLVPWKGHEVFLEACAQVMETAPCCVYIAGDTPDGEPGFKQALMAKAVALGIADHVCFLGHCPNVAPIIRHCDVLVHGSTAPEPFGRVILEAMCLGKPVVATCEGGPAEVIDHGKDGFLVRPGDPMAMARAVKTLLSDRGLRERMGHAAAQKAAQVYGIATHTRIILNTYGAGLGHG